MKIRWLTLTFRSLRRRMGYTAINVVGLAIGLAACLIATLYGWDAWRFDRYHAHAERIYRVTTTVKQAEDQMRSAQTPPPMAAALQQQAPAADVVARIAQSWPVVSTDSLDTKRDDFFFADPAVFRLFDIPFVHGDPATALDAPGSVVLTASVAHHYFGDTDVVGRTLRVRRSYDVTVTGVVEDPPSYTHWQYGLIARRTARGATWLDLDGITYVRLAKEAAPEALHAQLDALAQRHTQAHDAPRTLRFGLQPLTAIHLHSDLRGEFPGQGVAEALALIGLIALLLLVVASINYINLATAQAQERAREVGVRKTVGAGRGQLVRRFMAEALLLAGLAGGLALLLSQSALPFVNQLTGLALSLHLMPAAGFALFAVFVVAVGIATGSYPVLVLARYQPVQVLKGHVSAAGPARRLRQALVALQFGVAFVLLVGVIVVERQIDHMQARPLGFEAEHVVALKAYGPMRGRAEAITQELRQHPAIQAAAAGSCTPGTRGEEALVRSAAPGAPSRDRTVQLCSADRDFFETLGITLQRGRLFAETSAGSGMSIILNETATEMVGAANPLGQMLTWTPEDAIEDGQPAAQTGRVIGVIADFQPGSFRIRTPPMIFVNDPNLYERFVVTVPDSAFSAARAFLEAQWDRHAPRRNFEYTFLDEHVDALYRSEQQTALFVRAFAGMALFVACLGLFGLAAFTVEQRTKEIGVRKALGASAASIAALLSTQFAQTVMAACAMAGPVAYLLARRWLEGFAYPFDLGPAVFLMAVGLTLGVALMTVATQAFRAARLDPATTLRDG